MAYTLPITYVVGSMVTHVTLNTFLRDNLNNWVTHDHDNVANFPSDGTRRLANIIRVTLMGTPGSAPATDDADEVTTRIFATGTTVGIWSGSLVAGTVRILSNSTHTHGGL